MREPQCRPRSPRVWAIRTRAALRTRTRGERIARGWVTRATVHALLCAPWCQYRKSDLRDSIPPHCIIVMQQHSHYLRVILALQILLPVASALTPSFGQQACSFKGVGLAAIRGRAEALDRAHMYMFCSIHPGIILSRAVQAGRRQARQLRPRALLVQHMLLLDDDNLPSRAR